MSILVTLYVLKPAFNDAAWEVEIAFSLTRAQKTATSGFKASHADTRVPELRHSLWEAGLNF